MDAPEDIHRMTPKNLHYFAPAGESVPDRAPCCATREPLIVAGDLSVHYGDKTVLKDINMAIPRNCITAIVGPSGCGKSSFLSCINRMSDLTPGCRVTGALRMDGADLLGPEVDLLTLRRTVGMIFQKPNPFPLSIRKNLAFPLKQHGVRGKANLDTRVAAILQQVGLWEEVKDRLDEPALGLSGGQQQRLCLARALMLEPEVVLLDEPCSALDPIASGIVEELIVSLRGRYTVLIVTHNLAQARRVADDVALFWVRDGAGTLVEHGTAAEIFESPSSDVTAAYVTGARG